MPNFFECFIYLDIFGAKPRFLIDGYKSQRSYIGAFFSIVCILCVFLFFTYYFHQILSHKKPTMVVSNLIDDVPEKYWFGDDFMLAISLQYPNYTNFINENVYVLKIYDVEYKFLEDNSYEFHEKEIPYTICSNYTFKVLPEYYHELNLKQLYCVNFTGHFLEGEYGQKKWRTINFKFNKCKNSTNSNCLTQEEIEKQLEGGYVDIFMTDQTIDPKNYKNPTKIYGKNIFNSINGREYMDYWIYLKRMDIQTDNGILFDNIIEKSVIAFEKATAMKYTLQTENFLQVIFRISINKDLYDRSYMKLQEAAGGIGGVVKIVFTIGKALNYLSKIILYKNYLLQFFNMDYFNTTTKINKKLRLNRLSTNPPLILPNKNILQIIPENKIELRDYIQINNSNIHLQFPNNTSISNKQSISNLFLNNNKKGIKLKNFCLNNNNNNNKNNNKSNNNNQFYTDYNNNNNKNINDKIIKRKIIHYHSFFKILFTKKSFKKIFHTFIRYKKIKFLFEISRYIKNTNEINILKNIIFDDKQNNLLSYIYHFDFVYDKEKSIYEQLADYKCL
jgi:hypothetical protein